MATNRILLYTLVLLLTNTILSFGQQAEKVLVKSFNLEGSKSVTLDLQGAVEVKAWNGPMMRIQMTITLEDGSEAMIKSLMQAGRYNLKSSQAEGLYVIDAPNMAREVSYRGKPLEEKISFLVFAPEDVAVQLPASAAPMAGADASSL